MFELLEIYRNLDFKERIFPIVLGDANIFDPLPRLGYLKHWKDKKQELDNAIMEFGTDAITAIGDDYKTYKKVFDNFGEVVNILKDINSLTPDMHREDNFTTMIEAIEKLCGQAEQTENKADEPEATGQSTKKQRIDTSLKDITDRRKKSQLRRLDMLYKLLDDYENKLMLSDNPKETMRCETEIDKLNEQIDKLEAEINK